MPVSDDEIEMLGAYVDGELRTDEEDALRQRLEAEPALASVLEQLRAEREVRVAVWKSCEPDAATVARLIAKVDAAVDRHSVWAYRLSHYRVPFAAAACVLIGFLVGWAGRGSGPNSFVPTNGGNSQIANVPPSNVPGLPSAIPMNANPGLNTVTAGRKVDLPMYDQNNRQIGVAHFQNADEAAQFIEDLTKWQRAQEQIRQQGVNVNNGSEKF